MGAEAPAASAAATSKPRRRRKPQQSSHLVGDLVWSALVAKQQEQQRALAAQTRRHRKRAFRKPKSSKQLQVVSGDGENASTGRARDTRSSGGSAFVVVLENLVDPEELEDSDEYDDVVADLGRDIQSYGDFVSLQASRETGIVTLQLTNSDGAKAVVQAKHGKLFGGRQVVARLVLSDEGEPNPVVAPQPPIMKAAPHVEPDSQAQAQAVGVNSAVHKKKKRRSKCKSAALRARETTTNKMRVGGGDAEIAPCKFLVSNLIMNDEVEDEDEFEELQTDTRADFEKFGALVHLEVITHRDDSVDDNFHQHDSTTTSTHTSPVASPGDVVVEYNDPDCAATALRAYDGKVFGGRVAKCRWFPLALPKASRSITSILVENMLTPEELEDTDEFEDIRDEITDIFARHGAIRSLEISRTSGEITVEYESLEAAQQAVAKMNQSTYGGRSVKVSLLVSNDDVTVGNESQMREPEARPDRPFAMVTMQSEAIETVVQFLKRLASLQERAHQQNPLQDKRSRRLVLGLHEVKRGLLSKKIRLLIAGTDIEECGVLDEKLADILAIAKRDQVPVVFPLTRRKLGRVLSKNVRVSCVGVYSFEGANELFAEITRNVSITSANS